MQGLPSGPETRTFAEELLAKIPGSAGARAGVSATTTYQQREREAAAMARKNAAFALLSDDEDDFDVAAAPAPTTAPLPKQAARKSLRKAKVRARYQPGVGRFAAEGSAAAH